MQTANNNQKSNDSEWYFLAEYSLSELTVDGDFEDDFTAIWLPQNIQDLGTPSEYLKAIEKSLSVFAKEAIAHFFYGKITLRIYIHLSPPKKMQEDVDPAESLKGSILDHTVEPIQWIHQPENIMEGGWGYFVIKRGNDSSTGEFVNSHNLVDLYLYKEGE